MSAEYVLYGIAQSGNAYKPALMLNLCGADWTPRKVEYFQREDGWAHPYELMPGHPLE